MATGRSARRAIRRQRGATISSEEPRGLEALLRRAVRLSDFLTVWISEWATFLPEALD
jgi:hypothetical protein